MLFSPLNAEMEVKTNTPLVFCCFIDDWNALWTELDTCVMQQSGDYSFLMF